ncbi:ATP-binding protein [Paucibacter sp. APW11]|uniref:histidine kinase n=1 Tax=Roseateles aquae TaxID=3077235 RepID=A0ABU3PA54_9BURK|nr:ATP-binding protein [Paucibacter sp. APW11]MDT8999447.1 ATP-binding protein [Paucibacter sp. APW11]
MQLAHLTFHSSQAELQQLEQQVLEQAPSPIDRLALAWALRQSDEARSVALLDGLQHEVIGGPESAALSCRLRLLQGERALHRGQLLELEELLPSLLRDCAVIGDHEALADAHWLAAGWQSQQGDFAGVERALRAAIEAADLLADPLRMQFFRAELARASAFQNNVEAEREWAGKLPVYSEALHPAVAAALADYDGVLAALRADYGPCISWFSRSFEASMASGQLRRAVTLASNLGYNHGNMSQYEPALEWLQRGLELARRSGWAPLTGGCLMHLGDVLRQLGQLDAARERLHEALELLAGLPQARTTAVSLNMLARTELECGHFELALQAYERMQRLPSAAAADLRVIAGTGQARALLGLRRLREARLAIEAALVLSRQQGNRNYEIEAIWALADIEQALAPTAPDALSWYEAALAQARQISAYQPQAALLESASAAYAAHGLYERAYALAHQASAVRQANFSQETARRMTGMQAQHQIERTRAENEHLRRVAELETARYELLKGNHELMLHLSAISQEITTELDAERIYEVLERHVHTMLDAQSVAIYMLSETGEQLECAYGVEAGERFVDPAIALNDTASYCARCLRERREFVINTGTAAEPVPQIPGTTAMLSMMFVPLQISERVIGVMTVQSERAAAYGEREQLIFRMLCSYGAIALENARAHLRLTELQRHVMSQEKLAALGSMVAGVAHELNTPIGNSLLVASTLLHATRDFARRFEQQQAMRRGDLGAFIKQAQEGLEVIEHSMDNAGSLVRSFKQVAVDRSAEHRRLFKLAEVCEDCAQTLGVAFRKARVKLELQLEPELALESYPGALTQIIVILLNNALLHAFEGREGGCVRVGSRSGEGERVLLWIEDDGLGMSAAVRRRVFEPFFTTKFGQGGSGLGLSIAHNTVEGLLGGSLSVDSEPGLGSRFTLELPRVAP